MNGRGSTKIIGGILLGDRRADRGRQLRPHRLRIRWLRRPGCPRARDLPHLPQRHRPAAGRAATAAPRTARRRPRSTAPPVRGAYGQTTGTAYAAPHRRRLPRPPFRRRPTRGSRRPHHRPGRHRRRLRARHWVWSRSAWPRRGRCCWSAGISRPATTCQPRSCFAVCLGVVGLGLVVGTVVGRARGLIAVGALLVIATSIAGVSHVGLRGGVGERTWTPHTLDAVRDTYRLGIGEARVDLSRAADPPRRDRRPAHPAGRR